MAIESAADLASFFDTDEFGVTATVNGQSVAGLFMNNFEQQEVGSFNDQSFMVNSNTPRFYAPSASITATGLTENSGTNVVVVNSVNYECVQIRPDGTGMTALILIEQT